MPQSKPAIPRGSLQRVSFASDQDPDPNKDAKDPNGAEPDKDEKTKEEEKASTFVPQHPPHPMVDTHAPPPTEMSKQPLPPYVIEPPDILAVQYPLDTTIASFPQPVNFQSLVRPDGTISLGVYGDVFVGGLTLDQARLNVGLKLKERVKSFDYRLLNVDVLQYNSKFYYVITDLAGNGQDVERLPVTGNETVLDAISQLRLNGLSPVSCKHHIYLARHAQDMGIKARS